MVYAARLGCGENLLLYSIIGAISPVFHYNLLNLGEAVARRGLRQGSLEVTAAVMAPVLESVPDRELSGEPLIARTSTN